jgi:tellurite resistance protein TerC
MFLDYPIWMWAGFLGIIFVLVFFDLVVLHRKKKPVSVSNSFYMCAFYFTLAMLFNYWIYQNLGAQSGNEFLVGYLIELSLSVDNLFIFLLVFGHFSVPREHQHRVLFWGILGAIIFRGLMIGFGTAAVKHFSDILYFFGAFLVFTGIKMLIAADSEPDISKNRLLGFMRRHFRVTKDYHGDHFIWRENGVLWLTPLFLVLALIEISDIIFAVDSIPAIFAITQDPFIIFTSNMFAILGLRSLYFAMAAFMHRFEYLKYGLSLILVFIGAKMLINHYFEAPIIPTEMALIVTATVIVLSTIISVVKTRTKPDGTPIRKGWVPGSPAKSDPDNNSHHSE